MNADVTFDPFTFSIPSEYAVLCGNCGAIFHVSVRERCPRCTSKSVVSLPKLLNAMAAAPAARAVVTI